jgi:hypothetical protein
MSQLAEQLSDRFVGAYSRGSASARLRQRRWERLLETFPDLPEMHVLDIGGDARSWRLAGLRPAHLTLLNITTQEADEDWMTVLRGDACDPPADLCDADLVYSNSVIEHVGGHWRRQCYADVIREHAPRYWVQTPYRYFPVEPHFLFPLLQNLPRSAQAWAVVHWPLGNYRMVHDRQEALRRLMDIELLSTVELECYFPEATIERERIGGVTKSLIAVRS